jgi:MurNAc alpha-1-phosphate uridylyltransferase
MPSTAKVSLSSPPRAIVLAAGRGERMRPLTDTTPKPLLVVHGRPLIEWHLIALAKAGVRDVVVNTAWLEDQVVDRLGSGERFGLRIAFSREQRDYGGALETAGGIATALPLLAPRGDEVFWVVSADVYAPDFSFDVAAAQAFADSADLAQLWLVPNPEFHAAGDFHLTPLGRVRRDWPAQQELPEGFDATHWEASDSETTTPKSALNRGRLTTPPTNTPALGAMHSARPWTYANIALIRPALVQSVAAGQRAALGPLLFFAADADMVGGSALAGPWENVGTPAQLARLQNSQTSAQGVG